MNVIDDNHVPSSVIRLAIGQRELEAYTIVRRKGEASNSMILIIHGNSLRDFSIAILFT
jgi:hypothetical protein